MQAGTETETSGARLKSLKTLCENIVFKLEKLSGY